MEEQRKPSEEIDLLYFLRPVTNGVKNLGRGIERYSQLLWKNILLFSLIVIVITAAGYCLRFVIQPAYETKGIFISHVMPSLYCARVLKNLDQLKTEKNIPVLAHTLGINQAAAGSIQDIKLNPIKDGFVMRKKDDDSSLAVFEINLVLSDISYVDSVQKGIVNYLENNPFSLKRKEAKIQELNSLKRSLDSKLQGLDSLKKLVNSSIVPRSQGQGIILGEPINPISIVQAEVSYLREQLKIDEDLSTMDNIEVLQPFLPSNEYNYPDFNRLMFYTFILSLLIAGIAIIVIGKKVAK